MKPSVVLAAVFVILSHAGFALSQAYVEHLSPPVLQRGTRNRINITGSEVLQTVGIWTSLPSGMVHVREISTSNPGELTVELDPKTPLGIYGLRLATKAGLSNVHLFVVDELPVIQRESGLKNDAVVPVTLPATVTAVCRPATIDRYSITVTKDQPVTFEAIGNRLGKDCDPLVQVLDVNHKVVARCDNSVGLMFDCRFSHRFAEAGTYTVEIRDARFEGNPSWHYALRMGDFPVARSAVPSSIRIGETAALNFPQTPDWQFMATSKADSLPGDFYQEVRYSADRPASWIPLTASDLPTAQEAEPNDSKETATTVSVPAALCGVINKRNDQDWFAFDLGKDQKLTFQGVSRSIAGATDLELVLYDADGREVRRVDDNELEEGGFSFNVGKPGVHRLQVRDQSRDGGPEFVYRVDVRQGGPQFQLLADAADLTVPCANYQSLPIKVVRTEYNGPIQLSLRGAPPGLTLVPSEIPANETEIYCRVAACHAMSDGIFTIQVVGTASLEDGRVIQSVARTKPQIDRYLKNVDLIPYGLREDQRRLPPSLTDQIAVMVIPEAPFDVELPESVVQMSRFQTAEFPIKTTRLIEFDEPITFTVKGGQIGDEREERNQVYARFTPATKERESTSGTFFNRINTQLTKSRVDLTATTVIDGCPVNLVRSFTLSIRSAFQPTWEPEVPSAEPGGTVHVKFLANRASTFDGPVTLTFTQNSGFALPESITIPAGQTSVELDLKLDPKLNPGRHGLRIEASGFVGKYEESFNLPNLQIDVKKPM